MMKVKTPKQREWSKTLQEKALEFHGHVGPFMVVGLRMGLTALKLLDANGWFDVRCHVTLQRSPPDLCVIDGIQSSTGCTMGKRNIEVEEGEGIAAHFTNENEKLSIVLKKDILERIRETLTEEGEESVKELIKMLIESSESSIFEISLTSSLGHANG